MSYTLNTFYVKESKGDVSKFIIELECDEFAVNLEFSSSQLITSLLNSIRSLSTDTLSEHYSTLVKNGCSFLRKTYPGGHVDVVASPELIECLEEGNQKLIPSPTVLSITMVRDLEKPTNMFSLFLKFKVSSPKEYVYRMNFKKRSPTYHAFMCTQFKKMVKGYDSFYHYSPPNGPFSYKISVKDKVVTILDSLKKGVTFPINDEFVTVFTELIRILEEPNPEVLTLDVPTSEALTIDVPTSKALTLKSSNVQKSCRDTVVTIFDSLKKGVNFPIDDELTTVFTDLIRILEEPTPEVLTPEPTTSEVLTPEPSTSEVLTPKPTPSEVLTPEPTTSEVQKSCRDTVVTIFDSLKKGVNFPIDDGLVTVFTELIRILETPNPEVLTPEVSTSGAELV